MAALRAERGMGGKEGGRKAFLGYPGFDAKWPEMLPRTLFRSVFEGILSALSPPVDAHANYTCLMQMPPGRKKESTRGELLRILENGMVGGVERLAPKERRFPSQGCSFSFQAGETCANTFVLRSLFFLFRSPS